MFMYNEILNQVENLTSDEQLRLLEELAALVRRQITSKNQSCQPELQKVGIDKWRGFLPERVDALEFQKELRREWNE